MNEKLDPVDPKLKEAMAEIKAIIVKHDVAAVVCLCSGEKSEYMNHIFANDNAGPSWSCLFLEKMGVRVKAKASKSHVERYKLNLTVKALHTMKGLFLEQTAMLMKLCELLGDHLEIEHGPSAHEGHDA